MKRFTRFAAAFTLVAALAGYSFAQGSAESSVRGNLSGAVVDSSGAVVTGAKVTITGAAGTKSDTTNQEGQFLFPLLTPGFYSVKVEKGSFKTADVKGVEVVTGKTSNVRVGMVAGQQTEVVEVSGSAITVDTTSTAVAANLTDTFYQSVPVARGVAGLFYASPGVSSGGGSGPSNPSISGGSGLENNYVADGVNITDGGFGGLGVFSRNYGALSPGINLSFVKEVQVKTGGFEAQYGKSTGGIVQIVTKSGGTEFHGSLGAYFAPQAFEATYKNSDDFGRFNLQGKTLHNGNYEADAEAGGYVPGFKNKIFFFGSFNPQFNRVDTQFAQFLNSSDLGTAGTAGPTQTSLGSFQFRNNVYSYAGKVTLKLSDKHQFETSIFGDPTYSNPAPIQTLDTSSPTTFDKVQYGTRNFVVRYNGAITPTWLLNASWSWGHNNLSDKPLDPSVYNVTDYLQRTPCGAPNFFALCTATTNDLRGQFTRQGGGVTGSYENTTGDNYGLNVDTSKSFNFLGNHNVAFGYRFDRSHYDGSKNRTGAQFTPPSTDLLGESADTIYGSGVGALTTSSLTDAAFQLRGNFLGGAFCGVSEMYVAGISGCPDGGVEATLLMVRGQFSGFNFKTTGNYHTLFAQDAWTLNKYVTINAGLRWEQQQMIGSLEKYTFTDNWSPRIGIAVDPWGNRKTKIFANFGRYNETIPLDLAIRSLSAENDTAALIFLPENDGAGHVIVSPDGQVNLIPDAAHLVTSAGSDSIGSAVAFAPGTRMEYLDEYVVGLEHEFGNSGVIFTARYTDRRIKRIVEDMAALSPEAFQAGLTQQYLIANPSKNQDLFTNPNQILYNHASVPAACSAAGVLNSTGPGSYPTTAPYDSNGNGVVDANGNDSFCITNPAVAGLPIGDGVPDGFVDPVRIYKSMEFEVNKSFSKNWQMRANYRIAKLFGNYEGSYRNDNAQTDPNISSLFDFTQGDFNLLGAQFTPGVLNQDVRHLANGFVSYTFGNHYMKGLTMGTSVHFQTGIPINNLFAHPAYTNSGEIPQGGRGALGRTANWGQVDFHADYPIRLTERTRLRLGADLFNITDQRTQLRVDQTFQRSLGVPNADFLKPTSGTSPAPSPTPAFQRPFYARFAVKFEF